MASCWWCHQEMKWHYFPHPGSGSFIWGSNLASPLSSMKGFADARGQKDECGMPGGQMWLWSKQYSVLWQNIRNNHFQWFKTGWQREDNSDYCIKSNAEASKDIYAIPLPYFMVMIHMHPLSPAVMLLYLGTFLAAVIAKCCFPSSLVFNT